jgi:hypothetical protein
MRKMRKKIINNDTYFIRSKPDGFGYQIIRRSDYKCIFYTSSKEQVKRVFENLDENLKIDEKPEENFIPQLLRIKTKHYNYNYLVRNSEELDEISLHFLKRIIPNFSEWEENEPTLTLEYIEQCQDETIKEELKIKYNQQLKFLEESKIFNNFLKKAKNKIEKNITKNAYYFIRDMEYFDGIYLIKFDNDINTWKKLQ